MKDRIDLDDPNYNQNQNRVVIQDSKAKMLWVVLGIIAAIVIIIAFVLQGGSNGSKSENGFGQNESVSQNPHASCKYIGKDREYFAGPKVDVYFNFEHPEWGYHTH